MLSVGADCWLAMTLNECKIIELTARASYRKLPVTCCINLLSFSDNNGLISSGVGRCASIPYVLGAGSNGVFCILGGFLCLYLLSCYLQYVGMDVST